MNAVEGMLAAIHKYRAAREGSIYAVTALTITMKADDAIKELEAENAQLRLHWQREARNANRLDVELEQAETLMMGRCKDCAHWIEFLGLLVGRCEAVGRFSSRNYLETPDTFVCRWWAAREPIEVMP